MARAFCYPRVIMSSTSYNSGDQNEFQNLKRQARTNSLRLKIAQQNAALAALRSQGFSDKLEDFYDASNYVNLRDYLFETPPFFGAMPTTRNDRDEGRDFPIFRTEQELAVIRGAARLITANVVRSVKRGLSDFYPIQGNLEIARRVLRNMGEGSAVQAAIAWIQEMAPGTTQAQVNTGTMSRADASYTKSDAAICAKL